MTVLDRYLAREIIRFFGATLALVTVVYMIADFFEKVDKLIASGLPLAKAALYFLARIPFEQLLPASTLLSVMLVFGIMNKHNEIVALKTGGVSIYRLLKAPFVIGWALTVALLLLSEVLLPIVRSSANRIWLEEVEKVQVVGERHNVWLKGPRAIYHIGFFDAARERAFDISLSFFDADFRLSRRVDAAEGEYVEDEWVLREVMEQTYQSKEGTYHVTHHDRLALALAVAPEDLKRVIKDSSEMSLLELGDYIHIAESEGYDATAYRVDWHAKTAFPLVCVLLSVLAVTIAGRGRRGENLAIVVVTGIGLAFCFWVVNGFSLSLGHAGMLPPPVAAWLPNLMFLFLTVFFLLRAE
jgi:lipopolysaccharide export system permease protein